VQPIGTDLPWAPTPRESPLHPARKQTSKLTVWLKGTEKSRESSTYDIIVPNRTHDVTGPTLVVICTWKQIHGCALDTFDKCRSTISFHDAHMLENVLVSQTPSYLVTQCDWLVY